MIRHRSPLRRRLRQYGIGYAFVAVPVLAGVIFLLIPMITTLGWSFTRFNGLQPPQFVGIDNYARLFTHDRIFIKALWNTFRFTILGMLIGPTLGLLTALMLNQKVRFQAFYRTAYFLPVMTSLVVVATIWRMIYNKHGLLNLALGALGLEPIRWLSDPHWALFSIVIASVWQGFGFETVIFLAALQGIPATLYEAAALDGANVWQRFWHVTLPALRPVILFIYIIGIIGSFQVFDQVFVMTSGGPANSTITLVYYLYSKFMDLRLGYASAIAYVLFGILMVFSYLQWRFFTETD